MNNALKELKDLVWTVQNEIKKIQSDTDFYKKEMSKQNVLNKNKTIKNNKSRTTTDSEEVQ